MELTPVAAEDGSDVRAFDGVLDEHWTIGPKVHGGAMLALCAKAARTAIDPSGAEDIEPIAVSGSFLWAPDPGPLRVVTTIRKRGRRVNLVDVELVQGQRTAVRAAMTLAQPEHHVAPLLSANPVVPLMTPDPPPGLEPIGPGHPMADIVHLAHGCDIRPSLTTMSPRADGGPPVIEYWVRPREGSPDVLFALLCGDVSAPVTLGVNRFGWAPTVQLTAYLRGRPADGWLRVMCTTMQIGQEWFDEDHVVVDCEGRIIVQSRQLALVPQAPA
ncbi:thioesterase family protein [Mycolicibacterium sp. 050158]|jgi:Thioesterase-like superfamily|uniref:thioesterase family protein n=1 Tax=Mycolicibacterium sp. 050158 TaxID=3090602 RepID=UPI00299EBC6B|nr:thioesterase family protein [Mycolicibacterium sp. 050158]MDX1892480.1 thioesterase family protein [Mycolicibacterium sp. 050158]